jgi:hypothetical protein
MEQATVSGLLSTLNEDAQEDILKEEINQAREEAELGLNLDRPLEVEFSQKLAIRILTFRIQSPARNFLRFNPPPPLPHNPPACHACGSILHRGSSLNPDPRSAFQVNPDSVRIRIPIQGFDNQT